ncbi:hypothetical protein [Oricola sp.]|uniref:AbiTii domain-containing protein n=1 Tax=Oricola sp. TaxID=1979950 RepID=UPI003512FD4A
MALLHEIQRQLLDSNVSVGTILLKLRFLAAKLDTDLLEEWVQHETNGYPKSVPVPLYRVGTVTFTGTFANVAQQLNNVTIPSYLIEQNASEKWTKIEIRDGVAVIDEQLTNREKGAHFGVDTSNLKLLLQNKIYKGMAIIDIQSRIDDGVFSRIQNTVRSKVLDLTLKLEKEVPAATEIAIGPKSTEITPQDTENIRNITQNIIYGHITQVNNSGSGNISLNVIKGDADSLINALVQKGINPDDAKELAEIAAHDNDVSDQAKWQVWLKNKIKSGAVETWGFSKAIASEIITEALMQYWGLRSP